jgi:acyl carrier protein
MTNDAEWMKFAVLLADAAERPVETIAPTSRLVADLDLDSLGLAQLVVDLLVDFSTPTLANGLAQRHWNEITAGELFTELVEADSWAAPGGAGSEV